MVLLEPATGEWLQYLQQLLEQNGYWSGGVMAEYGSEVEQAVIAFQKDHGLKVDGAVRGETWAALAVAADEEPLRNSVWPKDTREAWRKEFPELYALAISDDFADYVRRVVGIDTAVFEDEAGETALGGSGGL
jgi:Putative peptidoglycan binding domain